jgi:hypothetical protein
VASRIESCISDASFGSDVGASSWKEGDGTFCVDKTLFKFLTEVLIISARYVIRGEDVFAAILLFDM